MKYFLPVAEILSSGFFAYSLIAAAKSDLRFFQSDVASSGICPPIPLRAMPTLERIPDEQECWRDTGATLGRPAFLPALSNPSFPVRVPACCTRLPLTNNSSSRTSGHTWSRRRLLCSSRRAEFHRAWSGRFLGPARAQT